MKKLLFRVLIINLGLLVTSCEPVTSYNSNPKKQVFLKKELFGFSTCLFEHVECNDPNSYCVESPHHLGGTRQCMSDEQIDDFFGCTLGSLIIHPAEPWKLGCY